jgi:hypothetical protein
VIVHEVRQILEAKAEALIRRQSDGLEALLHPDFVYVNARGTTFDKAGYIDTYCASGKVVFAEQQISDLHVKPFAGFAVATFTASDRFTADGRAVSTTYRSLCVFSHIEGRWLWAAGQTMVAN